MHTFNLTSSALLSCSIMYRDDGCSGKPGVAAFVDLVDGEQVDAIVGPVCSLGKTRNAYSVC